MGHPQKKTVLKGTKRPTLRQVTDQVLQDKDAYEDMTEAVASVVMKKHLEGLLSSGKLNKVIHQMVNDDACIREIFSELDDDDDQVIPTDPAFSRKAFLKQLSENPGFTEGIKKALQDEIEDD